MRCAKCETDNREGRKFCAKCAAPLPRSCAKCGALNEPGEDFCGECAAPLVEPSARSAKKASNAPILVAETLAPENLEGERKTITVLFADIKGSMDQIEDLDPEEARAIVDPALAIMAEAVNRYQGHVAQSTGDGVFALFGAPIAHEDHPQRAIYAALRMQEELHRHSDRLRAEGKAPVEIRIGINTGEVVMRSVGKDQSHVEYLPAGHAVGLASRLQALAPTGSIALSEHTRRLVEGYFQLRALGPTRIKGVTEAVNVYEVLGLGPLRTRLQRSASRGLSRFVGRDAEIAEMKQALEQAKSGRGQIVAVMAEPGVGKSRLFFEFKAVAQSGCTVLEALSISHGKASPYLPVVDLLRSYCEISSEDNARKRREKVGGKVLMLDRSLEDALPYLFGLLGIVEVPDPLAGMDVQIKRRRTLDAIKRILLRESLSQPLIVILEDLHWIDGETQALLNLLVESIGNAKVLLLVNYRPEYSHQWGAKTYYTQLRLDPLGQESAEEMLSALLDDGAELAPLKRLIIEKTEGNPLFMEEIFQALLEDGSLQRNGGVKLVRPVGQLRLPPTVQGILAARIDRLPAGEKDLLQTMAVIGKEFPLALALEVVRKPDEELSRMLNDLQLAEFIYEQPALGDVEYTFKHALTRQVAYDSLLHERRRVLHDRTGEAIEALFAGSLDDHLAELAHHFTQSANADKAVRYLTLSGKQSWERSAFAESQAQLQEGLEWAARLPESQERDAREIELASMLAQALFATRGNTAPETREAAARARDLAEKTGNLSQIVRQLFLIYRAAIVSGDYSSAAALADQILDFAGREGSPTSLAFAHNAQLVLRFFRGDLVGAEEHFARWSAFREAAGYGQVPGEVVVVLSYASLCAGCRGYAKKARERIAEAIAFARVTKSPFDLALGRIFESWLYRWLREPQGSDAAATQALALSEEHGFSIAKPRARTYMGWARAQLGSAGDGVSMIRQGLAGAEEIGARVSITDGLTCLAEAQALDDKIADALSTIEEALQANPEELVYRPNILTCRGELRIKLGQAELAEADFREAIALAQKMTARGWELRSTNSLARLLRDTNRRHEARAMLAEIYNWFTEGFDIADLKDAKALLDELAS